ncbi:MAG: FecR domain-containing protein [Chryseolinea sp.]
MENSELTQLLRKYLRGECSPVEQGEVDAWFMRLDKNPDDTRLLNTEQEQILAESILSSVRSRITVKKSRTIPSAFGFVLKVAASMIILALFGIAFFKFNAIPVGKMAHPVLASTGNNIITISNTANKVMSHVLPDGSTVTMQPGGMLEFPATFDNASRRVMLKGEAFFDVSREINRPFIITTNDVTVRVLGTSFNVKAYEGADEITVAVRTGKVLVSRPPDGSKAANDEIILTPNQEVVYSKVKEHFRKKLVATPQIILEQPTLLKMKFVETPANKLFEVLEENFGIDIQFDPDILSSCSLTTTMSEEGLYERIEIICKAIGAQYEIQDAAIVITSKGCK